MPEADVGPPQFVLAYDVGGSHISAAVCEQGTYTLRGLSRAPLPNQEGGHFSAASFCRLIHTLGEAASRAAGIDMRRIAGASLAIPGPFDYEKGVSHMQHKLHSIHGFDLKAGLATRFHLAPELFRFVNDAAAFTLGEAAAGAAKGYSRVVGITLGTGIGAAFAVHGRICDSSPGNPEGVPSGGELWNLPFNGATVEDFVSTRYLRHHYLALTGLEAEVAEVAAIAECTDKQPCLEVEVVAARQAPRPAPRNPAAAARKAFEDFGQHLASALNLHAAAFHPDIVVVGGGIARAAALFLPTTRKALTLPARIATSTLMDEAPLIGAAVHWLS